MAVYKEPLLTYLVLDYKKENESRLCLESIKRHTKFPHKVIYLHNGGEETYPYNLRHLCDHFIQTKQNNGLGIGTRDLFAASFSPYSFYLQNDQLLGRDFTDEEFHSIINAFGASYGDKRIASISVAGDQCQGGYSERGHIIQTEFYKRLEHLMGDQGYYGAGPYHDGPWREEQIQKFYNANAFRHHIWSNPLVIDNGQTAVRQNPDGSVWMHYPDTKCLWLKQGPVKEKFVYPKFTDAEWEQVIKTQYWEPGKIPSQEIAHSFHVWN